MWKLRLIVINVIDLINMIYLIYVHPVQSDHCDQYDICEPGHIIVLFVCFIRCFDMVFLMTK